MNKEKFALKMAEIKADYNKVAETFEINDGRDEGDHNANAKFCNTMYQLKDIRHRLSGIDLDEVDMDDVWRKNPYTKYLHLPEELIKNVAWIILEYEKLAEQ